MISRDSGLDTRDLNTVMGNRGVCEEVSMNFLSTPVAENDDVDPAERFALGAMNRWKKLGT